MKHARLAALAAAALASGGCDLFQQESASADTEMRNVEILPGTASDEMITLDAASGDGTAIDTSVDPERAAGGAAPDRPATGEDAPDPLVTEDDAEATVAGDVVIRPPGDAPAPPAPK